MKNIGNITCPLCSSQAKFESKDFNNRKHILCPNCNEFIISSSAEKKLLETTAQLKEKFSRAAVSAPIEKILVLTMCGPSYIEYLTQHPIKSEYSSRQEEI